MFFEEDYDEGLDLILEVVAVDLTVFLKVGEDDVFVDEVFGEAVDEDFWLVFGDGEGVFGVGVFFDVEEEETALAGVEGGGLNFEYDYLEVLISSL